MRYFKSVLRACEDLESWSPDSDIHTQHNIFTQIACSSSGKVTVSYKATHEPVCVCAPSPAAAQKCWSNITFICFTTTPAVHVQEWYLSRQHTSSQSRHPSGPNQSPPPSPAGVRVNPVLMEVTGVEAQLGDNQQRSRTRSKGGAGGRTVTKSTLHWIIFNKEG